MYFEKVLKGVKDLTPAAAAVMVEEEGIECVWRREEMFISTTAGGLQRFSSTGLNICFPAFLTALQFATANFTTRGFVFYAYYHQYLPYHREGEIIAKVVIPAPQIERAEEFDGTAALRDLRTGKMPSPVQTIHNGNYAAPDTYSNIREIF